MSFSEDYIKASGAWCFPRFRPVSISSLPDLGEDHTTTQQNDTNMSPCPSAGAFFTTYEAIKCALHDSSTHSRSTNERPEYYTQRSRSAIQVPFTHSLPIPIMHGIASCTAEMVSCLILTPAEVLKQNAQMINTYQAGGSPTEKRNNVTAMRQVLTKFKGHPWRLWSGYTALVGRNLPFTGLQFPLFEYVRSHVIEWWRGRKGGTGGRKGGRYSEETEQLIERAGLTGFSASVSGTVASFVTTPIDVIKTRIMLSATEGSGSRGCDTQMESVKRPTKGTFTLGKEIFQQEGVRGLFKGGAIRAGWTAVAMSLYLSMYEGGRAYLENRRKRIEGVDDRSIERSTDGDAVI